MENKMTTKKETAPSTPIARTSAGLRDAIFDEMDAIRNGSSNPTRANAVAKLAGSIVETVRMEIEVQRFSRTIAGSAPQVESLLGGKPMVLGA
jgi:hypothetical protein